MGIFNKTSGSYFLIKNILLYDTLDKRGKFMKKTKPIKLFYPGLDESPYYRIESLVRLKNGDIIAGADQRQTTESD